MKSLISLFFLVLLHVQTAYSQTTVREADDWNGSLKAKCIAAEVEIHLRNSAYNSYNVYQVSDLDKGSWFKWNYYRFKAKNSAGHVVQGRILLEVLEESASSLTCSMVAPSQTYEGRVIIQLVDDESLKNLFFLRGKDDSRLVTPIF